MSKGVISKTKKGKTILVCNLLESFLLEQKCRGNSDQTVKYYEHGIKKFIAFLEINGYEGDVSCINNDIIRSYILYLKNVKKWESSNHINAKKEPITSVSVQSYTRALKSFVSWLESENYIIEGIAHRIKLPKAVKKQVDILEPAEITRITEHLKSKEENRLRDLLLFSAYLETGARLEELVTLQMSDVRIKQGIMKVTGKGQQERYIQYGTSLQKMILNYVNFERPSPASPQIKNFFLQINGNPITRDTVRQLFRRLKKSTGIEKLHPHLLRHTMVTMTLMENPNVFALKDKTGHSSFAILNNYLQKANTLVNIKTTNLSLLDKLNLKT